MKSTIFCIVAPCSPLEVPDVSEENWGRNELFGSLVFLLDPENRGTFFRNICKLPSYIFHITEYNILLNVVILLFSLKYYVYFIIKNSKINCLSGDGTARFNNKQRLNLPIIFEISASTSLIAHHSTHLLLTYIFKVHS